MNRPKVLYIPIRAHTDRVFRPEEWDRFCSQFQVTANDTGKEWSADEIAERIAGQDALVTGWGSPKLTEAVFAAADRLRIVAHSAGSVRGMIPDDLVERCLRPRDIVVFSANGALAANVAESTVGMLIMVGHHFYEQVHNFRTQGTWKNPAIPWNTQTLNGGTIGIVSASAVGREVVRLLRPFAAETLLYDPFCPAQAAAEYGATLVGLDALFERSDYVSIHAPMLPETENLIGEAQLARMKPGAVLINTARGRIVDHEALLNVLKAGRIYAMLDVTEPEPLPADSPFRHLENCFITPHISGAGYYGYFGIGGSTRQALEDHFAGRKPKGLVPLDAYSRVA